MFYFQEIVTKNANVWEFQQLFSTEKRINFDTFNVLIVGFKKHQTQ